MPTVGRPTPSEVELDTTLTPQKDGSLIAEFDLGHTEEIKRWIQSFGKNAVVLELDQLRSEITGEMKALQVAYGVAGDVAEDVGRTGAVDSSVMTRGRTGKRRRSQEPQ